MQAGRQRFAFGRALLGVDLLIDILQASLSSESRMVHEEALTGGAESSGKARAEAREAEPDPYGRLQNRAFEDGDQGLKCVEGFLKGKLPIVISVCALPAVISPKQTTRSWMDGGGEVLRDAFGCLTVLLQDGFHPFLPRGNLGDVFSLVLGQGAQAGHPSAQ